MDKQELFQLLLVLVTAAILFIVFFLTMKRFVASRVFAILSSAASLIAVPIIQANEEASMLDTGGSREYFLIVGTALALLYTLGPLAIAEDITRFIYLNDEYEIKSLKVHYKRIGLFAPLAIFLSLLLVAVNSMGLIIGIHVILLLTNLMLLVVRLRK